MTESILKRVRRLIAGNVEDMVDAMEAAGGETVMRETIREVERTIEDVKHEIAQLQVKRLQGAKQADMAERHLVDLAAKTGKALDSSREDLAEAAVTRQLDIEAQIAKLRATSVTIKAEEDELSRHMNQLKERLERMSSDLAAFVAAKQQAAASLDIKTSPLSPNRQRVDKAEAAFDRAMAAAGGISGVTRAGSNVSAKLAELDALDQADKVSERLNAIKQERMAG